MLFGDNDELIITLVASIIAAISFAAFALPFLNKTEKKERYKSVIEKRRKALFDATRDGSINKSKQDAKLSASENMAVMFKVQELTGKMGENMRDKMLQAGYRNPKAPFKFLLKNGVFTLFISLVRSLEIGVHESPLSSDFQTL